MKIPVTIRGKDGCCFLAEAKDLSIGGMGLQNVALPLAVSDELTLKFTFPGRGRQVEMKAPVVWHRPDGTVGTRFTDLNASKSDLLRNWLTNSARMLPEFR